MLITHIDYATFIAWVNMAQNVAQTSLIIYKNVKICNVSCSLLMEVLNIAFYTCIFYIVEKITKESDNVYLQMVNILP